WTVWLLQAREEGRAPTPWLVPLMALWANMHGSFIVGLALGGAFGLEALLDFPRWRWRTILGWGVVMGACVVACCATPRGLETLLFPFQLVKLGALRNVGEWAAPNFFTGDPVEIVIFAGMFLIFWRGVR